MCPKSPVQSQFVLGKHCSSISNCLDKCLRTSVASFPFLASGKKLLENSAVLPQFPLLKLYETITPTLETAGLADQCNEINM